MEWIVKQSGKLLDTGQPVFLNKYSPANTKHSSFQGNEVSNIIL